MNIKEFVPLINETDRRSRDTLFRKNARYASVTNVLKHFEESAEEEDTTPMEELISLARKHWRFLSNASKRPMDFNIEEIREATDDMINYMRLLEALFVKEFANLEDLKDG